MRILKFGLLMVMVILVMVRFQMPEIKDNDVIIKCEVIESEQLPEKISNELSTYKPGSKHVFSSNNVTYAILTPYVGESLRFISFKNVENSKIQLLSYEAMFVDETYESDELIVKLEPYSGIIEFEQIE